MKKNMNTVDRLVRFALASVITTLCVAHFLTGFFAVVLLILAAVFYVAGITGFCPFFAIFNISSNVRKSTFIGND